MDAMIKNLWYAACFINSIIPAPWKQLIWFEKSGHSLTGKRPNHFKNSYTNLWVMNHEKAVPDEACSSEGATREAPVLLAISNIDRQVGGRMCVHWVASVSRSGCTVTFQSDLETGMPHCTSIHTAASSSYSCPNFE